MNFDFNDIRIWDILDVLIVLYLFYVIYQLLKGNIAFNIFIGGLAIFCIWKLTARMNMSLTSSLFEQIASVGILMLIIVFQPEIRRFLLVLGNTTLKQRYRFFNKWFSSSPISNPENQGVIPNIVTALKNLSKNKIGALIVVSKNVPLETISETGIQLDAKISAQLIESIFAKKSPLHDGAVIIFNDKILAASCVLPLSHSGELPKNIGLRHRAAIGTSEQKDVSVFIVSEETGEISFSKNGELKQNISENEVANFMIENLG